MHIHRQRLSRHTDSHTSPVVLGAGKFPCNHLPVVLKERSISLQSASRSNPSAASCAASASTSPPSAIPRHTSSPVDNCIDRSDAELCMHTVHITLTRTQVSSLPAGPVLLWQSLRARRLKGGTTQKGSWSAAHSKSPIPHTLSHPPAEHNEQGKNKLDGSMQSGQCTHAYAYKRPCTNRRTRPRTLCTCAHAHPCAAALAPAWPLLLPLLSGHQTGPPRLARSWRPPPLATQPAGGA